MRIDRALQGEGCFLPEGRNKRYFSCLPKTLSFQKPKSAHLGKNRKYADILTINVGRNLKIEKSAEKEVKNVSVFREK